MAQELGEEIPAAKRICSDACLSALVTETRVVECVEGQSALLQVDAPSGDTHYQWFRNGKAIDEGDSDYYDIASPVLRVHNVSLDMEKYTFCCNISNSEGTVESEPIQLRVKSVLDEYADIVKRKNDVLPACKQSVLGQKPLPVEKMVFNLALIQKQKMKFNKEFSCHTLQGFDDVMKEKLSIEYKDVFSDLEPGSKVLFLGRPGCGKSSLSQRITKDWAQNSLRIAAATLLFPVSLRACANNPAFNLFSILEQYFVKSSDTISECSKSITDRDGEGVCFLLDGLEDYSMFSEKTEDAFLSRLLKGKVLSKSIVMVTSKPSAAVRLQPLATRQVEILGLSNAQVHEYIQSYPFSKSKKSRASKMSAFLNSHPNVLNMCYLPYQLEIIASLYDDLENRLPCTLTKIYQTYCMKILRQAGMHTRRNLRTLEDLQPHEKDTFAKLCKLAYTKTVLRKKVVHSKLLSKTFGDDSTFLGLLSQDGYCAHHSNPHVFTFLNFTLQQYLAAIHMTMLSDTEQNKAIKKLSANKCMEPVIAFYFGSVTFSELDVKEKMKFLLECTESKVLLYVQCIFETRLSSLSDQFLSHVDKHIKVSNCFLSPTNATTLAYVLRTNKLSGLSITLSNSVLGLDSSKAFAQEIKRKKVAGIEKFSFHLRSRRCSDHTMACVVSVLKQLACCKAISFSYTRLNVSTVKLLTRDPALMKRMTFVDVSKCHLHCTAIKLLLNFLKGCKNLKVLRMDKNEINSTGYKALANFLADCECDLLELSIENFAYIDVCRELETMLCGALQHAPNLKILNMGSNGISEDGCKVLANSLNHFKVLEVLNISCNCIKDDGVVALFGALRHCATLRTLDISSCNFKSDGIQAVAQNLKFLGSLEVLRIHTRGHSYINEIPPLGAQALADNLQFCHSLQTLDLSGTRLEDGGEVICRELKHCTRLSNLNLSNNYCLNVTTVAVCLGESLKCCTNMKHLQLVYTKLSNEGALAIAEGLKDCSQLEELELQHNNIGMEGGIALGAALEDKSELVKVNVGYNNIGEGIQCFARSLLSCRKLTYFGIHMNDSTLEDRQYIRKSLSHCQTTLCS